MASFLDTHITTSAQSHRSGGAAAALGAAAVVMSGWDTAHAGRTRDGLNAGGTEALVVRCART